MALMKREESRAARMARRPGNHHEMQAQNRIVRFERANYEDLEDMAKDLFDIRKAKGAETGWHSWETMPPNLREDYTRHMAILMTGVLTRSRMRRFCMSLGEHEVEG